MTKSTMYMLLTIVTAFVAAITLAGLIYAAIEVEQFYWLAFLANLGVYVFVFHYLVMAKKAAETAEEDARKKARKEDK